MITAKGMVAEKINRLVNLMGRIKAEPDLTIDKLEVSMQPMTMVIGDTIEEMQQFGGVINLIREKMDRVKRFEGSPKGSVSLELKEIDWENDVADVYAMSPTLDFEHQGYLGVFEGIPLGFISYLRLFESTYYIANATWHDCVDGADFVKKVVDQITKGEDKLVMINTDMDYAAWLKAGFSLSPNIMAVARPNKPKE